MGRIVAIDYGQKRTGLATTDEANIIATPVGTVRTMDIFQFLHDFVEKNSVDCFVVGLAKNFKNEDTESTHFTESFVKKLQREFPGIHVDRMDERFTSLIATRAIRESGINKSRRRDKSLVDSISATLILQSYMESRSQCTSPPLPTGRQAIPLLKERGDGCSR